MTSRLLSAHAVGAIVGFACCSRPPVPDPPRSEIELTKMQRATGIRVAKEIQVLSYQIDRELLAGLEVWVLFCPNDIAPTDVNSDADWLELRILDSRVKVIEHRLFPRKIGKPRSAFHSEWTKNGRTIEADILHTDSGTYLEVIRAPN